jgi:hypothetical protein
LQHIADVPGSSGHVLSIKENLPAVRGRQSGDNIEKGGFSASAYAQQADQLPLAQRERHILQHFFIGKGFADPAHFKLFHALTLRAENRL